MEAPPDPASNAPLSSALDRRRARQAAREGKRSDGIREESTDQPEAAPLAQGSSLGTEAPDTHDIGGHDTSNMNPADRDAAVAVGAEQPPPDIDPVAAAIASAAAAVSSFPPMASPPGTDSSGGPSSAASVAAATAPLLPAVPQPATASIPVPTAAATQPAAPVAAQPGPRPVPLPAQQRRIAPGGGPCGAIGAFTSLTSSAMGALRRLLWSGSGGQRPLPHASEFEAGGGSDWDGALPLTPQAAAALARLLSLPGVAPLVRPVAMPPAGAAGASAQPPLSLHVPRGCSIPVAGPVLLVRIDELRGVGLGGLPDPFFASPSPVLKPWVRVHVVDAVTGRYLTLPMPTPSAASQARAAQLAAFGVAGPGAAAAPAATPAAGSALSLVKPCQFPGAPSVAPALDEAFQLAQRAAGDAAAAASGACIPTARDAAAGIAAVAVLAGAAGMQVPQGSNFVLPQDTQPCLNTSLDADAAALASAEAAQANVLEAALGGSSSSGRSIASAAADRDAHAGSDVAGLLLDGASAGMTPRGASPDTARLIWREPLVFEVPIAAALNPRVIVMFEVMEADAPRPQQQQQGSPSSSSSSSSGSGKDAASAAFITGGRRVAWGFIKPLSLQALAAGESPSPSSVDGPRLNVDLRHGSVPVGFMPGQLPPGGLLDMPSADGSSCATAGGAAPAAAAAAGAAAAPDASVVPVAASAAPPSPAPAASATAPRRTVRLARLGDIASVPCQLFAAQPAAWADRVAHADDAAFAAEELGLLSQQHAVVTVGSAAAAGGSPAATPGVASASAGPAVPPASSLTLHPVPPVPDVFLQYRMRRWVELPAALHVALAPAIIPAARYIHVNAVESGNGSGSSGSGSGSGSGASRAAGSSAGREGSSSAATAAAPEADGATYFYPNGRRDAHGGTADGSGGSAPLLLQVEAPISAWAPLPGQRASASSGGASGRHGHGSGSHPIGVSSALVPHTALRRGPTCLVRNHPALGRPGYAVALPTDIRLRDAIRAEDGAPATAGGPGTPGSRALVAARQGAGADAGAPRATLLLRGPAEPCGPPSAFLSGVPAGSLGSLCVSFSPDGSLLAVAATEERSAASAAAAFPIRVFNVEVPSRPRLAAQLAWHGSIVHQLSWSPDSQWLASASGDGTACVWFVPHVPAETAGHAAAAAASLAASAAGSAAAAVTGSSGSAGAGAAGGDAPGGGAGTGGAAGGAPGAGEQRSLRPRASSFSLRGDAAAALVAGATGSSGGGGGGGAGAGSSSSASSAQANAVISALPIPARPYCVASHRPPAYVYAARFHPLAPHLLVTGCFDRGVRLWDVRTQTRSSGGGGGTASSLGAAGSTGAGGGGVGASPARPAGGAAASGAVPPSPASRTGGSVAGAGSAGSSGSGFTGGFMSLPDPHLLRAALAGGIAPASAEGAAVAAASHIAPAEAQFLGFIGADPADVSAEAAAAAAAAATAAAVPAGGSAGSTGTGGLASARAAGLRLSLRSSMFPGVPGATLRTPGRAGAGESAASQQAAAAAAAFGGTAAVGGSGSPMGMGGFVPCHAAHVNVVEFEDTPPPAPAALSMQAALAAAAAAAGRPLSSAGSTASDMGRGPGIGIPVRRLVTADASGVLHVWAVAGGEAAEDPVGGYALLRTLRPAVLRGQPILAARFRPAPPPSGSSAAAAAAASSSAGSSGGCTQLLVLGGGAVLRTFDLATYGAVRAFANAAVSGSAGGRIDAVFSPDGRFIAAGGDGGMLGLWAADSGVSIPARARVEGGRKAVVGFPRVMFGVSWNPARHAIAVSSFGAALPVMLVGGGPLGAAAAGSAGPATK